MEFTFFTVLTDFFWASLLLFVAKLIREHVRVLQNFFIPVSLIAGFLAWIFGPYALKVIPFSNACGDYAGVFIILVFATIGLQGLGVKKGEGKDKVKDIAGYTVYRQINWAWQFSMPMVVSILLLTFLQPGGLNPAFGWIVPTSFLGGTGVAVAAGQVLGDLGFTDFTGLGVTASAFGILLGLIGGICMIKVATKRGYTSYIQDVSTISSELRTGVIPKDKRTSMGDETVSPIAIEPMAWHVALILIPAGLGYLVSKQCATLFGVTVPEFSLGFFFALILYFIFSKTKVNDSVDPKVINRYGNLFSDYLVLFSLAMIRADVIIKYAAPFLLLMLFSTLWCVAFFWFCAPRLIGKDWFERGIFNYGYATGVFATGFCLLRVVDPDGRSSALGDTAILTPFEHVVEIVALTLGPIMLVNSFQSRWMYLGIVLVYGLVWVAAIFIFKLWKKNPQRVSPNNPNYRPQKAGK